MVKLNEDAVDRTFAALADPTRRAILSRLAQGEASMGELAQPFKMSLPAVSKHVRVLRRAGLLRQHRQGRVRKCRLVAQPLQDASSWINRYRRFWENQLNSLAEYLERQVESNLNDEADG